MKEINKIHTSSVYKSFFLLKNMHISKHYCQYKTTQLESN